MTPTPHACFYSCSSLQGLQARCAPHEAACQRGAGNPASSHPGSQLLLLAHVRACRYSSLEVLFDILKFHGASFTPQFWARVFDSVLLPIFDHVRAEVRRLACPGLDRLVLLNYFH